MKNFYKLVVNIAVVVIVLPLFVPAQNIAIQEQRTGSRTYVPVAVKKIYEIDFNITGNDVYRPSMPIYYKDGLYVFDYSDLKVKKISFNDNFSGHKITVLGRGAGEGPGEFSNPTDMKIYNDKIYLADPEKGMIEIYSVKNKYIGNIKPGGARMPLRITVGSNSLVIEPRGYVKGKLFGMFDIKGKIKKEFGSYFDQKVTEPIQNDNMLSRYINNDEFFYLPRYRGHVAKIKGDNVQFVKYTIDGKKRSAEDARKEVEEIKKVKIKGTEYNINGKRIRAKYFTVALFAISDNFILIKAVDGDNDKSYYDIYTKDSFDYLFSIKDFPKCGMFEINGKYLYSIVDTKLEVFDISEIANAVNQKINGK